MVLRLRPPRIAARVAGVIGLTIVLAAGTASAADTGNGSKNFRTPGSVPNYFSNEQGPLVGGAAETRRGELYGSQAVAAAPRAPAPVAEAPRYRQRVAMAEPRGRVIRGRRGREVVARHVAVHGRSVAYVTTHGASRSHVAAHGRQAHVTRAASRSRAPVGNTRRRARG